MVLTEAVRSKVILRLRPWLQEDPDFELNLGLFNSVGILRNLVLDPRALNPLIASSTGAVFKHAVVRELRFQVSPLSCPALSIDLTGIDVTLTPRQQPVDAKANSAEDLESKRMMKVLASLDPEGVAVHKIIMSAVSTCNSVNAIIKALKLSFIRSIRIGLRDISFQLELLEGSYAGLLRADELSFEPRISCYSCLFTEFLGSFFFPGRHTILETKSRDVEFGLKDNTLFSCLLSAADISLQMNLNQLDTPGYYIVIPQADFRVSPVHIPALIVVLNVLSPVQRIRSGRELWKLAARGIGRLSSNSLYRIFSIAVTWIQYIHIYESLLVSVGYCHGWTLKDCVTNVSSSGKHSNEVAYHLRMVDNLETNLPPELVARARRIARHNVLSHYITVPIYSSSRFNIGSLWKFVLFFLFISKLVYHLFCLVARALLFTWYFLFSNKRIQKPSLSHDCLVVDVGELSFALTPTFDTGSPIKQNDDKSNQLSFILLLKTICLSLVEEPNGDSIYVALGEFQVQSCLAKTTEVSYGLGHILREKNGNSERFRTIVASDPVLISTWMKMSNPAATSQFSSWSQICEVLSVKLKLDQDSVREKLKGKFLQFNGQPFLLCKLQGSDSGSGILNCSFTMGKLWCYLDSNSISSLFSINKQVECSISCNQSFSDTSGTAHRRKSKLNLEDHINFYSNKLKVLMIDLIPKRKIQIAMAFDGININISAKQGLQDARRLDDYDFISHGHKDSFTMGLDRVTFSVCPASKDFFSEYYVKAETREEAHDFIWLKEPIFATIPQIHISRNFNFMLRLAHNIIINIDSLSFSVGKAGENPQSPAIGSISMTICFSTCRDSQFSFFTTDSALSLSFGGFLTGAVAISILNEINIICQVVFDICYKMSNTYTCNINQPGLHQALQKLMISNYKARADNISDSEVDTLALQSTNFSFDGSLELNSLDVVMCNLIEDEIGDKLDVPRTSNILSQNFLIDDAPDVCCGVFFQKSTVHIIWNQGLQEVMLDITGISSVLFKNKISNRMPMDMLYSKNPEDQSFNRLHQLSMSNFRVSLHSGTEEWSTSRTFDTAGNGYVSAISIPRIPYPMRTLEKGSGPQSDLNPLHQSIVDSNSKFWAIFNMEVDDVQLKECNAHRHHFVGASNQSNRLYLSISIKGNPHEINSQAQGGHIFLEVSAWIAYYKCLTAYSLCISSLISKIFFVLRHNVDAQDVVGVEDRRDTINNDHAQESVFSGDVLHDTTQFLTSLAIDIHHLSLTFGVTDASGGYWNLTLETDIKLEISINNFSFKLVRLTIISQFLKESSQDSLLKSHFCPDMERNSPSGSNFSKETVLIIDDQQTNQSSDSCSTITVDNGFTHDLSFRNHNYIMEHLAASINVRKVQSTESTQQMRNYWIGGGSVSGFDLSISLNEIRMLLVLGSQLSERSGSKNDNNTSRDSGSKSSERDSSESLPPDGAVVVIQDLHEHLYFAVDVTGTKYRLVGVFHYSFVGEKALFRVRYHLQKQWGSETLRLSLTSLFAKNDDGEPLCLTFCSGSGLVEVSSNKQSKHSLWEAIGCNINHLDTEGGLRPYDVRTRKAFHLVNSKSNYAVAFVDGLPEFVQKPGNPFKLKVINQYELVPDIGRLVSSHPHGISGSDNQAPLEEDDVSGIFCNFHCLAVTIDVVTLTILHQISDASDKIPLMRASFRSIHMTMQIYPSKFRILTTFNIVADVFSAQKNSWKDVISPTCMQIFLRSRFKMDMENNQQRVPVQFHLNMSQMNVSLTELSLDVILFVAAKLDITDPYAVKQTMIFANCCKIENHTGLGLSCQFANDREIKIAGNHSASVILRSATSNHSLPGKNLVSLCLSELGQFSTSPIDISTSKPVLLSWKTRVSSLKDSRSFPGPFLVIEVTRKAEEETALTVSPLLRVHNESGFSLKLRFQRSHESDAETASILLKDGQTIDDSRAVFDAFNYVGGVKKALRSLSLGNYLLSVRPEIVENIGQTGKPISAEWSDDLKGEKATRVSGVFNKLNYRFRKAFGMGSVRSSFRTVSCPLADAGRHVSDLYFLLHTIERDVPVVPPENVGHAYEDRATPVAFQVQKEFFFSPTIHVLNLLQSGILVTLTESHPDQFKADDLTLFGKKAAIASGSSANLYVNPAIIYITVTLPDLKLRCKPVNSGDWVKKLRKQNEVDYFDIDLDFGGGKYFASLRLSRAEKGVLEATVFTPYILQNNTELPLFCFASSSRNLSWEELEVCTSGLASDLGVFLGPESSKSWLLRSNKLYIKWLNEKSSEAILDLDILSGVAEVALEAQNEAGVHNIAKIGVSLAVSNLKQLTLSHIVRFVPRYIFSNESQLSILVRQCYLECEPNSIIVDGMKKSMLFVRSTLKRRKEASLFDVVFKKHKSSDEDSTVFLQFKINDTETSWSGPICISSLGRFFVKFRRLKGLSASSSTSSDVYETELTQFAGIHVAEENASLIMHFHFPPIFPLPYRIENYLRSASVTFYQKESSGLEMLGAGKSVGYVWDDLNLPHKLVVQVAGINLLREVNIDKVRSWKPFLKSRQAKGLPLTFLMGNQSAIQTRNDSLHGLDALNLGYEVYTDGLTRVLRVCELSNSSEEKKVGASCMNVQIRASCIAISFLDTQQEDNELDNTAAKEISVYSTIIVARVNGVVFDTWITDRNKYIHATIQAISVDEKWHGAPFASMFRRSLLQDSSLNENMLNFVLVMNSSSSNVKQVEYSSVVLQPFDLNLDEETLIRLVKFWRTSLSNTETQSSKFYFKHFEIHPIKVKASFLLGNDFSSYNSAQEAVRSFLHNFIKVPIIRNTSVELNGVLLTHALVTVRELGIKCVQHYSWYAVRGIYKAKGSQLLPPAFASLFDDSASSSLDIFFDPANGSINLPGLTLGMFKFVSTYVNSKGFSGTKRYFGDLSKTVKRAGSNALFAAVTEISDSILKGAERNGFNGLVTGFHQGLLNIAMEPSLIGAAVMEGGPDRKIKLDRSPGIEEQFLEGYLQAMLDVMYKQDYLRVRMNDNEVQLKNLPPNSSLINEIVEQVKSVLGSKGLLNAETSVVSRPIRHFRGENDWRIGPTLLTLCEHLFVSFAIRQLRNQAAKLIVGIRLTRQKGAGDGDNGSDDRADSKKGSRTLSQVWTVGRFVVTGMVAYIDGRLCRHIPNPVVRRIVSGFMLSYLERKTE